MPRESSVIACVERDIQACVASSELGHVICYVDSLRYGRGFTCGHCEIGRPMEAFTRAVKDQLLVIPGDAGVCLRALRLGVSTGVGVPNTVSKVGSGYEARHAEHYVYAAA